MYSEPTAAPTCTGNVEDPAFACECFDNDPAPDENCPRYFCTFNTGPAAGSCKPIEPNQPGGPNGTPNPGDEPVECDINDPHCAVGNVCVDGIAFNQARTVKCSPLTGTYGTRYGCCKSMSFAVCF